MRARGALIVALTTSLLVGCGNEQPGTTRSRSGVAGLVHLWPRCPVQTPARACGHGPAVGSRVTVAIRRPERSTARGPVVGRATTDTHGGYRVTVPPGTYVVTAQVGRACQSVDVRVSSGAYATVDLQCDTGIR